MNITNMLKLMKTVTLINSRTFKNFGHKRQPTPAITVLWHGFLTFTFIGLGLEWEKIAKFLFGDNHGVTEGLWQLSPRPKETDSTST